MKKMIKSLANKAVYAAFAVLGAASASAELVKTPILQTFDDVAEPVSVGYKVTGLPNNEVAMVYTNHLRTATWTVPATLENVQFLVVGGGGGGGGGTWGPGGGGGGVVTGYVYKLEKDVTVDIKVGAGGKRGTSNGAKGTVGDNSSIIVGETTYVLAYGGGAGGNKANGVSGGSGSGGGADSNNTITYVGGGVKDALYDEAVVFAESFGHQGGTNGKRAYASGGGGGAMGDGGNGFDQTGGAGGVGLKMDITGSLITYGSGGGGGGSAKKGSGGTNAGNGGYLTYEATSAVANRGGGGGGGGNKQIKGGNGGSGIVVFRYAEPVESPAVVQIGETTYTSIPAAIAAANEGDTIKVIAEVNVDAAINVAKKVTIDLNGQTVRATEKDTVGDGVFCVVAGGDLTINDSVGTGVVNGVGGNPYNMAIWANGGKVTINGGTYTNEGAQDDGPDGAHFDLIYAKNGGEVVINGGYFKCETPNFTLNCHDASYKAGNTSIVVKGGTFYKFNPSNNTAEGAGTNFCADGYAGLSNLDDEFVVGVMPTATVKNLGSMTIPANEHYVYNGSLNPGTEEMPLNFVMQFVADQKAGDMATSPFADWYGDFVISFEGIENGSFDASGCYLAGYYGSTESWDGLWVKIPVDGHLKTIREGERYPVMLGVGMAQTYNYICSGVQAFSCAMYIPDEILKANPNLKVKLELNVVDSSKGEEVAKNALVNGENIFNASDTEYTVEDFKKEEAVKLYIRIVDGKPQIGFEGEGTLVLEAAVTLTGEWTKNISYTIVENDGDDTKTWVTPAEGYYFFKGFITM